MSRLVALYPAAWRARYEDEFRAALAMQPMSIRDRVDVLVGVVDAHLHPQAPAPRRVCDRYGIGPLVGLVFLAAAMILAVNGPLHYDEYGSYRDGAAALPFFVLALVLLSVGLYRVVERLPADAQWPRALGWTAIVAGPIWALMPWVMAIGLLFIVAVVGLAVGARRAGIVPAWAVILLVAMLAVPAAVFASTFFLPWYAYRHAGFNFLYVIVPLSGLWLVVGGLVLRGFPRPAE